MFSQPSLEMLDLDNLFKADTSITQKLAKVSRVFAQSKQTYYCIEYKGNVISSRVCIPFKVILQCNANTFQSKWTYHNVKDNTSNKLTEKT